MKVIGHEPHGWFLLEERGALILDVNCSHSSFAYDFTIEMNADEVAQYRSYGRIYVTLLAQRIQDSVPILKESMSAYKERGVMALYSDRIMAAVRAWSAGPAGIITFPKGPG